jgi:hypothetical protein
MDLPSTPYKEEDEGDEDLLQPSSNSILASGLRKARRSRTDRKASKYSDNKQELLKQPADPEANIEIAFNGDEEEETCLLKKQESEGEDEA